MMYFRLLDQQGEDDTAADLGRRHQTEVLIDARRKLLQARGDWCLIMVDLHRFMVVSARVSINHDGRGGTAPDPLVCDQGSKPKIRKLAIRVTVDLASLPGPPGFLNYSWVQVHAGHVTAADVAVWPYNVGVLVRFTVFFGTLHWPSDSLDLGHFGISFLELLIIFEQWAGHRLLSEKVTRPHVRAGRPILVPSVPVSEGIEIRHGCQFISGLVRALGKLPGGLGRFLPCQIGTHLSRLRHLGWNQCFHGLTSRQLESCHHRCLSAVCGILCYPKGSAAELLDGVLKLRCCTTPFSNTFPTWFLPPIGDGRVRGFDVATCHSVGEGSNEVKRVRLTRKTRVSVSPVRFPDQVHSTPRRWKRLRPPFSEGVVGGGVLRNLSPQLLSGWTYQKGLCSTPPPPHTQHHNTTAPHHHTTTPPHHHTTTPPHHHTTTPPHHHTTTPPHHHTTTPPHHHTTTHTPHTPHHHTHHTTTHTTHTPHSSVSDAQEFCVCLFRDATVRGVLERKFVVSLAMLEKPRSQRRRW